MSAKGPVRVVVVDDSPTKRAALAQMLRSDGIAVVGYAGDPEAALRAVVTHRPDVVTMDLEMPRGGGQQAIEQIMASSPVPILVLSSHAGSARSVAAIEALGAGALDVFPWPDAWDPSRAAELRQRVASLRGIAVLRHPRATRMAKAPSAGSGWVLGVAASTGGPPALAALLAGLNGVPAPVLVVQHLHPDFLEPFTTWMARAAGTTVALAVDGTRPHPGAVYVAPAHRHLRIATDGRLALSALPERLHRPSADELFESMATACGARGIGVVLTGMGDDGASGLGALRRAGGVTMAQDEATSAVWGMPQAAWRQGAAERLVSLDQMALAIRTRMGR